MLVIIFCLESYLPSQVRITSVPDRCLTVSSPDHVCPGSLSYRLKSGSRLSRIAGLPSQVPDHVRSGKLFHRLQFSISFVPEGLPTFSSSGSRLFRKVVLTSQVPYLVCSGKSSYRLKLRITSVPEGCLNVSSSGSRSFQKAALPFRITSVPDIRLTVPDHHCFRNFSHRLQAPDSLFWKGF